MTQPALTVAKIARAIADKRKETLRDGITPGLSLVIGHSTAAWSLQFMQNGVRQRTTLGYYPAMTLAMARKQAVETREAAARYTPTQKTSITLLELLKLYGELVGSQRKTWEKNGRIRILGVFRSLADTPLPSITAAQLQTIADRHPSPISAACALSVLRPVLRWARKRGLSRLDERELETPVTAQKPRERVLSDKELKLILPQLAHSGFDAAIRFMLLSACRPGEAIGMQWREVDMEAGVWTIPAARAKSGREHAVPLSTRAQALLTMQPRDGRNVFCVTTHPFLWQRYQARLNARTGTSGWYRHDLRRTSATVMGRLGVPPHIIEQALGHAHLHSRIASVYNKSRYFEEHRDALERLSNYYDSLITD